MGASIIAITNQKGGVGKTTTSINLAFYLAKAGKKTLLIDFDPQGNSTSGLNLPKESIRKSIADVITESTPLKNIIRSTPFDDLFVAPALSSLATTEASLAKAPRRFTRLKSAIESLPEKPTFDYIIIDCPPSLSLLTINALVAANFLILPVQTEFYALEGVTQLLESMKLVEKSANPNLKLLGVLPTMVDPRTTLSLQVLDEIKKYFGQKVFETVVPRNVRLAEAPSHGVPIGAYDRFSKGARAYKNLAQEVIDRVG